MMRVSFKWVAMCVFGVATSVQGQTPTVTSYLDRTEVGLNEQFVLSLEISGGNATLAGDPRVPDLSAFANFLGTSSSRQIQIVNAQTTVSTTLQYRFLATRQGTFEIGGIHVELGGQTYTTAPLTIEIVASPVGRGGTGGAAPRSAQPERTDPSGIAPEDLFLRATASKRRVYENEPVIVEYKIYTVVPVTSYSLSRQPGTTGFWVEDFELPATPQTRAEVLDGRRYTVATLKKAALFPTGPGTRTIDPMAIDTEVRVRSRSQDPFEDFFGRSSIFGQSVSKVIASQPLTIEVLPLPSAGRPDGFSGFVGTLAVSGSTDKTRVETNEAVTLQIEIVGTGNLRALPDPEIEFPSDFEVYPPEFSERVNREGNRIAGTKTYEYVIIPRAPGTKTIPTVTYTYFDPARQTYAAAETGPIDLEVTGDPVLAPVTTARGRGAIRTLRNDIRFIQTEAGGFRPVGRSVFQDWGFWLAFLLPLMAVGGAVTYRRHHDRMAGDVAYARHRRASKVAKKRLSKARGLAHTESQRAFYAEMSTALTGFLADRLNLAEAGLVHDDARRQLGARGVPEDVIAAYFACLDVCDRNLFSPTAGDTAEMTTLLDRAAIVMSDMDRALTRLS